MGVAGLREPPLGDFCIGMRPEGSAGECFCEIAWEEQGEVSSCPVWGWREGGASRGLPGVRGGDTHTLPFIWAGPLTSTEKSFFLGMSGGKLPGRLAV